MAILIKENKYFSVSVRLSKASKVQSYKRIFGYIKQTGRNTVVLEERQQFYWFQIISKNIWIFALCQFNKISFPIKNCHIARCCSSSCERGQKLIFYI